MRTEELTPTDLAFMLLDNDTRPQNVAVFCALKSTPNFSELRDELLKVLPTYPRLKFRLEKGKHPTWIESEDFDLNNHLHYIHVPSARIWPDLLGVIDSIIAKPLLYSKPPWEMYLISCRSMNTGTDESEKDVSLFFYRAHHSWTDGMGGVEVLNSMSKCISESNKPHRPPRRSLSANQVRFEPSPGKTFRALLQALAEGFFSKPALVFPGKPTDKRVVLTTSIAMRELRHIKRTAGVSSLATFLGLSSLAVYRYRLEELGTAPKQTRVIVPFNLRKHSEQHALGNKLGACSLAIDIDPMNPFRLFKNIDRELHSSHIRGRFATYSLVNRLLLGFLPACFHKPALEFIARRSSHICTYLRMPMKQLSLAGSPILNYFALPALMPGQALGWCFIGHEDLIFISLIVDPGQIDNPTRLLNLLLQAKQELLERPAD